MDDITLTRLWLMRAGFAALILGLIFYQLLPLETTPRRFAGPDLVMGFAFAWVLRRPEYTPLVLTAGLLLIADLFLGRPPGLYAALTLLAFDNLRTRTTGLRAMPFTVEWLTVAAAITGVILVYRLILAMLLVPLPALGLQLMQLLMTVLCYPLVVLVTRFVFGLRAPGLGEVNALGQRQ
ncbi:rod shape-determining protein MreD [Alisedimentitalea sp. MJ-SS2]|uniref:rod shape-determining protein MreD n=1 Tax=Aliisedimentitalea sp. MJ-SS2 TaxID=3049795 RepID=UPI00290F1F75|nr:rod shape-determining protein MreD [Alisedimentitalea sp. MJ-SS2]MDU8928850.1 rod shape-determining protein MreD [Alisedimentitalea sp. MJ-SS2]